jgi:hypothetical protein
MSASIMARLSRVGARVTVRPEPVVARPYVNPYAAGVGVGVVLLAAFVLTGRGLGASGAFSSVVTAATAVVAPHHVEANPSFATYLGDASHRTLADWLVFEVLGIALGGLASAAAAGRLRAVIERGPRLGRVSRLATGFAGGSVMGLGAKLARGCTSGLGLSGWAVLSVGSWLFILCAFAAGYAIAPLLRRLWT